MKGQLLPKWLRVKNKSKFLYPRLKEEGIEFGVDGWNGTIKESPINKLYKKYSHLNPNKKN